MSKVTVDVTQEIIDRSNQRHGRGDPYTCPVGLALKELGFTNYAVFGTQIRFRDEPEFDWQAGKILADVNTSPEVGEKVEAFDHGEGLEPFSFELELPDVVPLPFKAVQKVRVEVSEDDIANGRSGEAFECPLSLAIQRATGYRAGVTSYWVRITTEDRTQMTYTKLPREATNFIAYFDSGRQVYPFCFELDFSKEDI